MLKKLFKKIRFFSICGSKCMVSINDKDKDGIPDEIVFDKNGNELLKIDL